MPSLLSGARGLWSRYDGFLKQHPVVGNACSSGSIVALGDYIAQYMERQKLVPQTAPGDDTDHSDRPIHSYRSDHYEWRRTIVMSSFIMLCTPMWLQIYKLGDRVIKGDPSVSRAMRQGLFTWCIGSAVNPLAIGYITLTSAYWIHGVRSYEGLERSVMERLQHNYFTHIGTALCFWSTQWPILFYYLPKHLRMFYASWLSMMWNGIVSYIQHRD